VPRHISIEGANGFVFDNNQKTKKSLISMKRMPLPSSGLRTNIPVLYRFLIHIVQSIR
jgi:hypothetical protein